MMKIPRKNNQIVLLFLLFSVTANGQEEYFKRLHLHNWEVKPQKIFKVVECALTVYFDYESLNKGIDSTSFISYRQFYNKKGLLVKQQNDSYEVFYAYDNWNRIERHTVSNEKGRITYFEYSYLRDKVVVSTFDLENKMIEKEEYLYKNNNLVQVEKYDRVGDLKEIRLLVYNVDTISDCFQGACFQYSLNINGQVKEMFQQENEGVLKKIYAYKYDNKGLVVEKKVFDNNMLINIHLFRYKKGVLIGEEVLDRNNKVINKTTCRCSPRRR